MRTFLTVLAIIILAGCVPYADKPLTDFGDQKIDSTLFGSWCWKDDNEQGYIHIGLNEKNGKLNVTMTEFKGHRIKTTQFSGHTSILKSNRYMNLKQTVPKDNAPGWLIIKYSTSADSLTVGLMNFPPVKDAIKNKKIEGVIEDEKNPYTVIKDSRKNLQQFLIDHDASLFDRFTRFSRLKNDCAGLLKTSVDVNIQSIPELKEQHYFIKNGPCIFKLVLSTSSLNKSVLSNKSNCELPEKNQLSPMKALIHEVFRDKGRAEHLKTFFWGRLARSKGGTAKETSYRLALSAWRSPEWNPVLGKPIRGNINKFCVNLAQKNRIYPEIADMFSDVGKTALWESCEKVLVTEAENLSFFNRLKKQGVKPKDRLPFDCMVWFSLT